MKALVTGITGQDGPYLAKLLLDSGYEVFGTYRREATAGFANLDYLGVRHRVQLLPMELTEYESVRQVMDEVHPYRVYNLAAQSHVGMSFKIPIGTLMSTGMGAAHILEAIRHCYVDQEDVRVYQASTSELYGGDKGQRTVFDESDPFHPRSPYACAKLYAYSMMQNYREAYGIFICNGILFNHESPLRGPNFVTRKVTMKAADIVLRLQNGQAFDPLQIGNVDATRDWGHAEDYVRAMYLMMEHNVPGDYVVSTGENHSIRELIQFAFKALGFSGRWEGEGLNAKYYIHNEGEFLVAIVNPKFFRPSDCTDLTGDSTKARMELGWSPRYSFEELVEEMTKEDYRRLAKEWE